MAEMKTKATKSSVSDFLNGLDDPGRRKDGKALAAMMTKATKSKPVMWGPSIIGFGDHEYTGANGKTTKWFQVGFSPRKDAFALYLLGGKDEQLMAKLPAVKKSSTSMAGGCIYVKRLADVDQPTLEQLISGSVKRLKQMVREKKSAT